jgi:CO/xanthine dehydrogenase FAD-binding subunit
VGEPFTATLAEYVGGLAAREIKPISDVRASLEYRQTTAAVIVRDALLRAWDRAA